MTIVWSSNIVRIDWNFGRWGRDVIPNSIKLIAGRLTLPTSQRESLYQGRVGNNLSRFDPHYIISFSKNEIELC